MPHGTITRLNSARGFGFLTTQEGVELFFHRSGVQDIPFSRLQVGDRVTFEIQHTTRGPRAGQVQLSAMAAQLQVNLAVRDLERAIQFYIQVLGFKRMTVNSAFVLMHRGSLIVGLKSDDLLWHPQLEGPPGAEMIRGLGVELVLEVTDIEFFYTQTQQAGVTIQEPLMERPWGAQDFRVADPDGYYWRITSPRKILNQLLASEQGPASDAQGEPEHSMAAASSVLESQT